VIESVIPYHKAGLCVLPAENKFPILAKQEKKHEWVSTSNRIPSYSLFEGIRMEQICMICGKVSGDVEVIDVDKHMG
jgi:hypothetical protein